MPTEFLMILFLVGFYIVVSRALKSYSDTDIEKAASLALLEEPKITEVPQDSRHF